MQQEVGATSGVGNPGASAPDTLLTFIYAVVVCKSGEVQFTPAVKTWIGLLNSEELDSYNIDYIALG